MTPPRKLHPRNLALLRAVAELSATHGWPPSLQEIADALGLRSRSNVLERLRLLERAGLVERGKGPREMRVTEAGHKLVGQSSRGEVNDD